MPWINSSMCTGCGICERKCPANAIKVYDQKAELNQESCIRCGICHSVCPRDAVRHDSELIPEEIDENMKWVERLQTHPYYAQDHEKQAQLIKRLKNHFNKNMKIAQQTLEQLNRLDENTS
jgi:ferredoxin